MKDRGNWARALRLLWEVSPWHVGGVITVAALASLLPAATVQLTTLAVQGVADAVASRGAPAAVDSAFTAGVALCGLMVLTHVLAIGRNYLETLLQLRMSNTVNERIMAKATRLRLEHFEDSTTYDRLQRASREAAYRPYQIFAHLITTVSSAVSLIAVSVVLLSWNVGVAIAILLAPLPSMASRVFYSRVGWKIENERSADRRRATYLQFLVTNDRSFKETHLFGLGPLFLGRYRDLIDRFYRVDRDLERKQAVVSGALGLLSVCAAVGATLYALQVTMASGQVGQFAGYLSAITLVQSTVQALFGGMAMLYEHNLFLGNLFGFLDIEEGGPACGTRPFPPVLSRGIEFRDVSFTYPGTETPVLSGLNLVLPAGKCVALVGQNGAGKTTLVKLLARFYEPTGGQILIDGVPLTEYDLADLRANIGVIFQDFVQYEASARENIGFGRASELDDTAAIRGAAGRADALSFVEDLPQGLDTQLGRWFAGGSQLSGGQWQKVALSRAFLRDAPIVVLDEPTAAIDAAAEAEIFARMSEIAGRATTLLIAHRFSTVRAADHIVVIDHGRVLEEGTHGDLMATDGVYANLFRLQAAGYLDEPVTS
ncbi:ABC transporter ATP-binding protein/permease [Allokutzneria sp. A3M-2-11 16]|uniref:ABC transporter ATP-binding protein n=1 Tax=Allokutzneria sp. A3M-2-11 16 TaxID=2962043 RepID=UPI0020B68D06|nr:ABC transporter ATP-binding protein [Allokutzneria sp. A3M-2-11 16]MCP3802259.1 ABC transporter ATP-binding protein/permease [Allokutzneria sp. A3M-2-11 16]